MNPDTVGVSVKDRVIELWGSCFNRDEVFGLLKADPITQDANDWDAFEQLVRGCGEFDQSTLIQKLKDEPFAEFLALMWMGKRQAQEPASRDCSQLRGALEALLEDPRAIHAIIRVHELGHAYVDMPEEHAEKLREARESVRDVSTSLGSLARMLVHLRLAWVECRLGEFTDARISFEESLNVCRETGFLRVQPVQGIGACYIRAGRPTEGVGVLRDPLIRQQCIDHGLVGSLAAISNTTARAAIDAGDFEIADEELARVGEIHGAHEVRRAYQSDTKHMQGLLALRRDGDAEVAEELITAAQQEFQERGNVWGVVDTDTSLAEVRLALGFSPGVIAVSLKRSSKRARSTQNLDLLPRIQTLQAVL